MNRAAVKLLDVQIGIMRNKRSLNIISIIFKDYSMQQEVLYIQKLNKQVTTLLPKLLIILEISIKEGKLD